MQQSYQEESWRPIAGFEGLYEVSNLGQIRSVERVIETPLHPTQKTKRVRSRVLSQKVNRPAGGNYKRKLVSLWKGNIEHTKNVAKLVAQAFIENPENCDFVLHLDDDATNNAVWNLQWGDHKENVRQAVERRRYRSGDCHHSSKMTLGQRKEAWQLLAQGCGVCAVARQFNVSKNMISDLKAGRIAGFEAI